MSLMQFAAVVLMIGLTLKLLMLPRRVEENKVTNGSRWLMLGGTALLGLQFLLQLVLGLRERGVTQAVMLNLGVFTLVSWLLSLAVLRLLTQGRLSRTDAWLGGGVWLAELAMIGVAAMTDGQALLSDTPRLQLAEQTGSVFYFAMQCYYGWRNVGELRRLRRSLDDYYDNDLSQRLAWMQVSICVLAALALFVPAMIFVPGWWLMAFAVVFFYGTWYFVDSFCDYVKSSMPGKVESLTPDPFPIGEGSEYSQGEFADDYSQDENTAAEPSTPLSVRGGAGGEALDAAIARWTAGGSHLKSGLKKPFVAEQMGVSENQLTLWLRQHNRKFADWLSDLRVEEAKRIIRQYPDWTNEAIADHCGFTDRIAFQKKFKQKTGLTPTEWIERGEEA